MRGAGEPSPAPENEMINLIIDSILHDRKSYLKTTWLWFTYNTGNILRMRRYNGREADALAREVEEGRGKLR